jgi:hypothetical protein
MITYVAERDVGGKWTILSQHRSKNAALKAMFCHQVKNAVLKAIGQQRFTLCVHAETVRSKRPSCFGLLGTHAMANAARYQFDFDCPVNL